MFHPMIEQRDVDPPRFVVRWYDEDGHKRQRTFDSIIDAAAHWQMLDDEHRAAMRESDERVRRIISEQFAKIAKMRKS